MSRYLWCLLPAVGFVVGYGVGVIRVVVVQERRRAAWRDRALRHH